MKRKKITYHYSGKKSELFWRMVNSLPEPEHDLMYSLGVALQNHEGHVLREMESIAPGFLKRRDIKITKKDKD